MPRPASSPVGFAERSQLFQRRGDELVVGYNSGRRAVAVEVALLDTSAVVKVMGSANFVAAARPNPISRRVSRVLGAIGVFIAGDAVRHCIAFLGCWEPMDRQFRVPGLVRV